LAICKRKSRVNESSANRIAKGRTYVDKEVDDTAGVSPLVVVPGDELDEAVGES